MDNNVQTIQAAQNRAARRLDRYNRLLFTVAVLLGVLIALVIFLWTPLGVSLMNQLKAFVGKTIDDALAGLTALVVNVMDAAVKMRTLFEFIVFVSLCADGLWRRDAPILIAAGAIGMYFLMTSWALGSVVEVTEPKGIPMVVNSKLPNE